MEHDPKDLTDLCSRVKDDVSKIISFLKATSGPLNEDSVLNSFSGKRQYKLWLWNTLRANELLDKSGAGNRASPFLYKLKSIFQNLKNGRISSAEADVSQRRLDIEGQETLVGLFKKLRQIASAKQT